MLVLYHAFDLEGIHMHKDKQTYLQKTKKQNQSNRKAIYIVSAFLTIFVITLSVLLLLGK